MADTKQKRLTTNRWLVILAAVLGIGNGYQGINFHVVTDDYEITIDNTNFAVHKMAEVCGNE